MPRFTGSLDIPGLNSRFSFNIPSFTLNLNYMSYTLSPTKWMTSSATSSLHDWAQLHEEPSFLPLSGTSTMPPLLDYPVPTTRQRGFRSLVCCTNRTIWTFLDAMKLEQGFTYQKLADRLMLRGPPPPRPPVDQP